MLGLRKYLEKPCVLLVDIELSKRTSSEVIVYLTCAVDPEDDNKNECNSFRDFRSRKALYYYIVPGENFTITLYLGKMWVLFASAPGSF